MTETLPLEPPATTVEVSLPPGLETAQDTALATRQPVALEGLSPKSLSEEIELSNQLMKAEASLIDRIWTMAGAEELMKRRAMLIESVHVAAVRATNPADWIISRDRQGVETAMLRASGSTTVGTYYGISFTEFYVRGTDGSLRPVGTAGFEPTEERDPDNPDEITYTVWFDAESFVTGRKVRCREFSRSNSEQFLGRGGQDSTSGMVARADHRKSTMTGAYTVACRILGNMTRLDVGFLKKCYEGTGKSIDNCCKGSGFGSSAARSQGAATGADVMKLQAELRDSLLAITNNDQEEATGILFDSTEYPPNSGKGCKSVEQITNPGRFFHTWRRIAARPDYGKAAEEYVLRDLGPNASKQAKDGVEAGKKDRK